ncbi:PASTA domain-containing protein [Mucilaginibacter sp. X4EP1]|uniref:PASTA domain-containing protein n=1 Tax=Mucilaginibacter sp. X4EP1 TaxID=2723092 RepID=UPI0021689033|nr:PASTA domain-containing protein [Mucilaginibacter sp. X4EP1]MCS3815031.1 beta-lactam-binding protein with PASTA domain [Mucilaginibacter sp. X4EP1]
MNKFWAYLKTKQFRNTIILAAGSVLVVILVVFFSLGFYTRHGTGIPVPQLKGMQIERAMSTLKDQGFDYKIDSVYVLDKPPGSVVEQDPDSGTYVKENRTIYLTVVTREAPLVALPDLEPLTYREAAATLANYGLKIGDTTFKADIANHVLDVRFAGQSIKAGTKLPKGSKIDLVIGNGAGPSEVDIPDLVNQDLSAAKFIIKNNSLTLGTITYQGTIPDSTNLVVVQQSPMKTDSVNKTSLGTRINLTVTQGTKTDESH